jgi:hypothetical protein
MFHQTLGNLDIFTWNGNLRRWSTLDQNHGKALGIQAYWIIIHETIEKNEHPIRIMRTDGRLPMFMAVCAVGCDDQVITFLSNNCLNPIEKRNEEIVLQVATLSNRSTLSGEIGPF